jgi:hypothetical protein
MNSISVPGLVHVEGVLETCKTVQEALNWRGGMGHGPDFVWKPCIIDEQIIPGGIAGQMQQGDVCMEYLDAFDPETDGSAKLDRSFVLSPENQRRHSLVGKYELYGTDTDQTLVCDGEVVLQHPEHGKMLLSGIVHIWPTQEKDHISNVVRVVVD